MPRRETPLSIDPEAEGFTQVPEGLARLYKQAGLSAGEIIVFQLLMRWQVRAGIYSRPVSNIAAVSDMSEGTVRNALVNLRKKGFLQKVGGGHRGRSAEYAIPIKGLKASRIHDPLAQENA